MPLRAHTRPRPYRAEALGASSLVHDTSRSSHAQWPVDTEPILDASPPTARTRTSARHASAVVVAELGERLSILERRPIRAPLDVLDSQRTKHPVGHSRGCIQRSTANICTADPMATRMLADTAWIWKAGNGPFLSGMPVLRTPAGQPCPLNHGYFGTQLDERRSHRIH